MKYIKKNQPPEDFDFIEWKNKANEDWQPNWDNFQKPEKTSVHNSLLKEQGFICCYCGRRINQTNSHIEHLKPRNKYPKLALDYDNFLASCEIDKEEPPPIPVHCGHKKDKWYDEALMVSPLDSNCADFFRYTDDGQILATTDPVKHAAAKETIKRLALDINKLNKIRGAVIDIALSDVDKIVNKNLNTTKKKKEIKNLIKDYEQIDSQGEYEEFCSAIAYVLKQLIT